MSTRLRNRHSRRRDRTPPPRRRRIGPWVLLAVVAVIAALAVRYAGSRTSATPEVPRATGYNVLLITTDTTRADRVGCYGRPNARTPHIDQLARDGLLFECCLTCSPLTLPSHASILTGVYPHAHGARRNATDRVVNGSVTLAEVLSEAGYRTQALLASIVLDRRYGLDQGFVGYRDVTTASRGAPGMVERPGDQISADAIRMLRALAAERFFLWVHFYDPHYPYVPRGSDSDEPAAAYADEIAFMDQQIGRILREMRLRGLENNTLVVLVGDHGEGLGEHDEWLHGCFLYDSTLHVPLIFRCPGVIPPGQTSATLVRTIDIAPTILDLIGAPPLETAQGMSLLPLIRDSGRDLGLTAYSESVEAQALLGLSRLRSLRAGEWKYILAPDPELYHLTDDPDEQRNQIAAMPELAEQMRAQMRTLIADSPPPPTGEDGAVVLTTTEIARLESLGYTGTASKIDAGELSELDLFEPSGADPKAFAPTIRAYEEATWHLRRGELSPAETLFREVIAAVPQAARPRADLAQALQRRQRLEQALETCEEAIRLEPDAVYLHRLYADLLFYARRWEDMATQLAVVLSRTPDDGFVHYRIAVALTNLHRLDEARAHLADALTIDPRDVKVLHLMGVTYRSENRLPEATEWFRKAAAIAPNHPQVRESLQQVLKAMDEE